MIIGAAGHIDHGKTSLVKVITGVDADRLKEEKRRGITIDLGFAYWPQEDGSVIGFVDAPGHERFVHNMLAGAHGVDMALLVVAADDGVMPQTREHLEILELLGVTHAVVALSKIDRVDASRIDEVERQIARWLAPSAMAGSPVFPISNITRAGVTALEAHLRDSARKHATRAQQGEFRLAIDRSFVLQGAGVVVTGMALDGSVRIGDEVTLSPSGIPARVRSIHAQNRKAEIGRAGERCAINLVGPDISKDAICRGDMLLAAASHAPTQRIDAEITVAAGLQKSVTQWMPARLHHAASEVGVRIVLLGEGSLAPGARARVQLVLDKPIAARARDYFILRDVSAACTLGGGRFIDLRAPDRKRRTAARLAVLDALALNGSQQALTACLALPAGYIDLDSFARDRGASPTDVEAWLAQAGATEIRARGVRSAVSNARMAAIQHASAVALADYHAENPDRAGLGLEALRLTSAPLIPALLYREILRRFVERGILCINGGWARLPDHRAEFSPADEKLWSEIAPALLIAPRFRPPRVRDICILSGEAEEPLRRLFKRLARRGEIVEIAHDHFFPRATVSELARMARDVDAASGACFTAGAFRNHLEADGQIVGRKVAIEILEFFDRHGYTIRRGDQRRINPHRTGLFEPDRDATTELGRESSPVGRPDFKSGWGRETVPGGFDSHSLPPDSTPETGYANGA